MLQFDGKCHYSINSQLLIKTCILPCQVSEATAYGNRHGDVAPQSTSEGDCSGSIEDLSKNLRYFQFTAILLRLPVPLN